MVLIGRRRTENQAVFDTVQEQHGADQRIVGPVLHHQINGAGILRPKGPYVGTGHAIDGNIVST